MLDHVLQGMKTVVIGGSGGIRLADARGLQAAGDAVAIRGRNREKDKAEANLRSRKLRVCAFRVNVTDREQFQETNLRIVQEFSFVNTIVNSQADTGRCPIVDIICVRLAPTSVMRCLRPEERCEKARPKAASATRRNSRRPPSIMHRPAQVLPPAPSSMAAPCTGQLKQKQ